MNLAPRSPLALLITLAAALTAALARASAAEPPAFPTATPESVGMNPAALQALDDAVKGFITQDQAVGAELLVIKNRKTVWHTAHGLRDNITKAPMQPSGIFCVRSQTKPLVGTAIQMLIDAGKLKLDEPASKYLPAFDNDTHRAISIQNLLEHRSGLPLSSLITVNHKTLRGVQDVAELAGKAELEFTPGERFNYSDDGTDTLTAILEKVSGQPAEVFIQERILTPLGMIDTIPVVRKDDPRVSRINSAHGGGSGAWMRFWAPGEDPVFPYFLGSQALYSTCEDYARFLCLWADGGVVNGQRLLSPEAIHRGLTPASDMDYPSPRPEIHSRYGQLWMTCTTGDGANEKLTYFGHGGSDGTTSWMWPDLDLIVCYFTQSRVGATVITIDQAIDKYLIRGDLKPSGPRAELADYEGIYWNTTRERYWMVRPVNDKLSLEIQGRAIVDLVPAGAPKPTDSAASNDDWKFELSPNQIIHFDRDPSGKVTALLLRNALADGAAVQADRITPDNTLPTAQEVVKRVAAHHGLDAIDGVIRRTGTLEMPAVGVKGPWVNHLAPKRSRTDATVRDIATRVLIADGEAHMRRGDTPVEKLAGGQAEQAYMEQPLGTFGDWTAMSDDIRVLKRLDRDGGKALLIRVAPRHTNAAAFIVDEATGRVLENHRIVVMPGLGSIGLVSRYENYESVGGATLPKLIKGTYATPLLGDLTITIDSQELIHPIVNVFTMDAS